METVQRLIAARNRLGEGPLWNENEQALYWVDIEGRAYHRYHPTTGEQERVEVGLMLGVMRFRRGGGMVMATDRGIQFWDAHTRRLSPVADPEAGKPDARFNDGAVDPQGRFWAGTMAPGAPSSALYRLDINHKLQKMDGPIGTSNGITWSLDGRTLYFTDSPAKTIYAYDFDRAGGNIYHRRPFIHTPDEPGFPDGLIVDSQGFLWSARWGGWKISRYDPSGQLEREIAMPVEFPTSCAFGGSYLNELYITSAWTALGESGKAAQPWAGDLFVLYGDIRGQTEPAYAG